MEELWKPIFNGLYQISSFGNVVSNDKLVRSPHGGQYLKEGRLLKQNDNGQGYLQVQLCDDGKCTSVRVHILVAKAFIDNPLNLPKVNHKDLDKYNNLITNLEWCTQAENVQHAKANGRMIHSNSKNTVLTEADIPDIRKMIAVGLTNKIIAEMYGVHPGTIGCIRSGRNWSHVK